MPAISAFQRLPPHIAEKIAYYCVSIHLVSKYTDPDQCKEAKPIWGKLYDVSYLWRNLALERFSKELTINVTFGVGAGQLVFSNMPDEIKIDAMHYAHVKRVSIKFPAFSNPSVKKATQDFSAAWPETLVLPSARSLNIDLAALYYQEFDEHSATRNERFFWITQRVESSMPKLQKVAINDQPLVFMCRTDFSRQRWNADRFLATVFGTVTSVSIETVVVNLISDHTFMRNSSRLLTKLEYDCNGSEDELFGYIVEKTAPTLESLRVLDYYATSAKLLVLGNNGKPIVYPRLQRLEYEGEDNTNHAYRCRVDKRAAPFPALRYLSWSALYMFEDDTLFRGNSGTLEYMSLIVDDNCIGILQRHGVFGGGKYSRLKHVSLADSGAYYGRQPPVSDAILSFAATVTTAALEGLSLECEITFEELVGLLDSNLAGLRNIQTLGLRRVALTLPKVIELVRRLPNMARLRCDTILGDQSHSNVNGMYKAHYPASQRLTFLDLSHVYGEDMEVVANLSLTLATMCPRFASALVPPDNAAAYRDNIRKAVASGAYADHRDKIQRFLRNTLSN
ncbi:hypothetical protein GGI23_000550 [Coemansia sp. RSA 2559]|nr:hypothetical protein GGI23_000550 [Coemansia sp. RSA 2559]KAJ2869045.1 hypothetical protein GGI22_000498 [Coemansia erecta]